MVVISLLILIFAIADDDPLMSFAFNQNAYKFSFDSCVGGVSSGGEVYSKTEHVLQIPNEGVNWRLTYNGEMEDGCQLGVDDQEHYDLYDTGQFTVKGSIEGTETNKPVQFTKDDVEGTDPYYYFPKTALFKVKENKIDICNTADEIQLKYIFTDTGWTSASILGAYGLCFDKKGLDDKKDYGGAIIFISEGCGGEYICKGILAGNQNMHTYMKGAMNTQSIGPQPSAIDVCRDVNGVMNVAWSKKIIDFSED